ncbi:MAG TPA: penicillin-insensitive murein endopeptidase [Polyangiaceae bacterium]|nr:penicillin-insensitive murein endopeptidase [Polyangiaceae bacterium]
MRARASQELPGAQRWLVLGAALALVACSGLHGRKPESPHGAEAAGTDGEAPQPRAADAAGNAAHAGEAELEAEAEAEEPHDALDDSGDSTEPAAVEALSARPHPLDSWTDAQIKDAVKHDLRSLGPMSLGSPNAGALLNGVQASENPFFKPISPSGAWSTQETLDFLSLALGRVHEQFPGTPPLALGDISGKSGGPSPPHVSHQSGRDVDIAYFYNDGASWYARGTVKNLDLPRNWAFVRALIAETDVDLILIDHSIQALLEEYARKQGEDPAWLSGVFRGVPGKLRPLIRHAPGHATHIHIRFFNPVAQETARRCHSALLEAKLTQAPQSFITHKVKKNETLGMISRKYGVSVPRLRAVNGLKSSLIRAKSSLRVPVATRGPTGPGPRLRVPARRVPPASERPRAEDAAAAQPPPTK